MDDRLGARLAALHDDYVHAVNTAVAADREDALPALCEEYADAALRLLTDGPRVRSHSAVRTGRGHPLVDLGDGSPRPDRPRSMVTTFPLVPAPLRASLAARRHERHERRRLAHDLAQYRTPQERLELSIMMNREAA